jgi:hypothetical protein
LNSNIIVGLNILSNLFELIQILDGFELYLNYSNKEMTLFTAGPKSQLGCWPTAKTGGARPWRQGRDGGGHPDSRRGAARDSGVAASRARRRGGRLI